jgi:RecB family endonuclease NucS
METDDLQQIHAEIEQLLRENARKINLLGSKFGGPTEGMALPSMRELLEEQFQMNITMPRVSSRREGRILNLDMLAYSNSGPRINEVYIVEVKSHPREEGLDQMKRILREFREFFPEHKDKKIYGILAAVDAADDIRERVLREGIYLARIHDEELELDVPKDFKPRAF